ncbi:MAG: ABC-three component system middle component 7 [Polaromonas sp.]
MKSILDSETEEESVQDIYRRTRDVFWDASEFLHALDALFVLALLEIDADSGLIQYA